MPASRAGLRWPDIIAAARPFDIEPRIAEPLEFSRHARVLLLRHGASQLDIDVILCVLPFERDAVWIGQSHSAGPFKIRLPRVEDLMVMKAVVRPMHVGSSPMQKAQGNVGLPFSA